VNRNFSGRISPDVKANFLASPPLVVAYAIAGTVNLDMENEPLGTGKDGQPVYLKDIWPSRDEVMRVVQSSVTAEMFNQQYGNVYSGNPQWNEIPSADGDTFKWNEDSTYIQEPPFFVDMPIEPLPVQPVKSGRVLGMFGDSVTTDHISPAGPISLDSPAGHYLMERDVEPQYFNAYGARRGNDRVMTRGTFANVRLRNRLVPGSEGNVTYYLPTGEKMTIFDAAMKYIADKTPLVILAGKDYGMGSSRDWAAKGTNQLGVRAVIAQSYERIHRSNLVMMGVLPLVFEEGQNAETLGLTGHESFDIPVSDNLKPAERIEITATAADGKVTKFTAIARVDTPVEVEYYKHGGILQFVLRQMMKS
jgi:aconitate hydratase